MRRDRVAQQPPATGLELDDFPAAELRESTVLARAHRAHLDAGWFASGGAGRFDLRAPRGTCYAADSIAGALRESLGVAIRGGHASRSDATRVSVSLLRSIRGRFAASSVPDAAKHGVTGELSTMTPYAVPQQWARVLHQVGFDGIRYAPRFLPGPASAWAIFGPAGQHPLGDVIEVVSGVEACRRAGLGVLPDPPSAAELTTLASPAA